MLCLYWVSSPKGCQSLERSRKGYCPMLAEQEPPAHATTEVAGSRNSDATLFLSAAAMPYCAESADSVRACKAPNPSTARQESVAHVSISLRLVKCTGSSTKKYRNMQFLLEASCRATTTPPPVCGPYANHKEHCSLNDGIQNKCTAQKVHRNIKGNQ